MVVCRIKYFTLKKFNFIFYIKAIGLFLNRRIEFALEQIESILTNPNSDSNEGKILLLNVIIFDLMNCLQAM